LASKIFLYDELIYVLCFSINTSSVQVGHILYDYRLAHAAPSPTTR